MGKRNPRKKILVPKITDRGKFGALYSKTAKICIKHGGKRQNAKSRLRSRHQRQYFELLKKKRGIKNHFKYQLICKMRLTLAQHALLVKLFYPNQSNAAAGLPKFRSRNNLHKGPLSMQWKQWLKKFEKTNSLTTRPGKGWKPISEDTIIDVVSAIVETN